MRASFICQLRVNVSFRKPTNEAAKVQLPEMVVLATGIVFCIEMAEETARTSEYCWHKDANRDPFAKLAGLI